MALPLNLNAKNIPNADFFLVFEIYVYFLWASASELQPKISAKNSALLKEDKKKILFWTLIYLSVALGLRQDNVNQKYETHPVKSYFTKHVLLISVIVWRKTNL